MGLAARHLHNDPDTSPYDSSNSLPSPPATPGTRPRALAAHIDDLLDAEEDAERSTSSAASDDDDDHPSHNTRARPRPLSTSAAAANAAAGLSSPSDDGLSPAPRRTHRNPAHPTADLGAEVDDQLDDEHDGPVTVHDDDIDDCFDSDEQHVDVESLASSAPDDQSAPTSPVAPQNPNRQQPPRPAARPGGPTPSLLSRASQTFYKAFRKTMGAGAATNTSSGNASAISTVTSASDPGDKSAASKKAPGAASSSSCSTGSSNGSGGAPKEGDAAATAATERHERLTRLIDAQLAALAGARTGFVDLSLLRPLAEQTAAALTRDARPLLGDSGELETRVAALQRQMDGRRADAEAETVRKERVLIEAKVALAETMGEVERLRGELAAARRELAQPGRVRRGAQKQARDTRDLLNKRREQRVVAEGHVQERKVGLARERAELERLEEGVRDVEGDWA